MTSTLRKILFIPFGPGPHATKKSTTYFFHITFRPKKVKKGSKKASRMA